jgi:hypothetical protein
VFNCVTYCDIPDEIAKPHSKVPEYKKNNNLVSENMYLCWGKLRFGDRLMNMATQAASLTAKVDSQNNDIPFASPSNKNLQMQGHIVDNDEFNGDLSKVNMLNGNGITTALNFSKGWVLWGNRTGAYPGNTDPKDSFINNRRMLAWFGNTLVLTWMQKVDDTNRRLVETIVNSVNYQINGLVNAGALLGGRVEVLDSENSLLDRMDGRLTFNIFLGLVAPAEEINFKLEFDPYYLETLFG